MYKSWEVNTTYRQNGKKWQQLKLDEHTTKLMTTERVRKKNKNKKWRTR